MIYSRLPDNKFLLDHADKIAAIHKDQASSHPCTPDGNFMGLLGERKLAYLTGSDMDLRLLPGGDDHIDVWLNMVDGKRYPSDAKIARKPTWLLVEQGYLDKIPRDRKTIFVLGRLLNGEKSKLEWDCELLKWDWCVKLRQSTPEDKGGKGIISYHRKFEDCRDIYELLALVNREWRRGA